MTVFKKIVGILIFIPFFILLMMFGLIAFTNMLLATSPR